MKRTKSRSLTTSSPVTVVSREVASPSSKTANTVLSSSVVVMQLANTPIPSLSPNSPNPLPSPSPSPPFPLPDGPWQKIGIDIINWPIQYNKPSYKYAISGTWGSWAPEQSSKPAIANCYIPRQIMEGSNPDELLAYHSTPHQTTGKTPAELLHGRPMVTPSFKMPMTAKGVHRVMIKCASVSVQSSKDCASTQTMWGVLPFQSSKSEKVNDSRFKTFQKIVGQKEPYTFVLQDGHVWNASKLTLHVETVKIRSDMSHDVNVQTGGQRPQRERRAPVWTPDHLLYGVICVQPTMNECLYLKVFRASMVILFHFKKKKKYVHLFVI